MLVSENILVGACIAGNYDG